MAENKKATQNPIFDLALDFILKNKFVLSIVGGALIAVLLGFATVAYFNNSNNEKANKVYDMAISYLNNLGAITNDSDRAKVYQEQINSLNGMIQAYSGTLAAVRARLLLGKIYYESAYQSGKPELLNMALNYYTAAFERSKSEFYRSLALIGQAQCNEQKGDLNKAFEQYGTLYAKYPTAGFAPYALVGMARTKEMQNDPSGNAMKEALQYYQKLVREFPDSAWVRYAKGKLYATSSKPTPSTQSPTMNPAPFLLQPSK